MILSWYKKTCELLLYYPKTGGGNSKEFSKKSTKNILYSNIDERSRWLIAEFPEYRIKFIEKLQSHCENMTDLPASHT